MGQGTRKPSFDVEDAIELLTNGRDERCAHERAIRLFQFHTWMWFPGKTKMNAPKTTGRLASALILRHIQRERFGKGGEITIARQKSLFGDSHYRKIYSQFIAPTGGWSNQLRCSLKDADHRLDNRRSKSGHIIVDLMDYRVRQVLSPTGDPTKSKISHAVFFNCWPARAQHNSSPTGRTMWSWWGKLQSSSMFIYLSEKLGPLVHDMGLNDKDFLERITAAAEDEKALTRFFATYSFLRQAFANVDDSILWPRAPSGLTPCPFSAPEFTSAELKVIAEYADHHEELDERCEGPCMDGARGAREI